jgi:hypothetical protein
VLWCRAGPACPNPSGGQPLGCGILLLLQGEQNGKRLAAGWLRMSGEVGVLAGSRNKESGGRHGEMRTPSRPCDQWTVLCYAGHCMESYGMGGSLAVLNPTRVVREHASLRGSYRLV